MSVRALQLWLRAQALLWLPALGCVAVFGVGASSRWPQAGAAAIGASYLALAPMLRCGARIADVATFVRLAGLLLMLALVPRDAPLLLWSTACAVVVLDLVDGALARRFGGSDGGAVLDMETDQFTVLGLSLLAVELGAMLHVLLLPAMRYLFVLAMWIANAPAHDPKPVAGDNRRGRLVCAAVMVSLLIAVAPGTGVVRDVATAVAALLLAWSFAGDARFLVANVRRARAAA